MSFETELAGSATESAEPSLSEQIHAVSAQLAALGRRLDLEAVARATCARATAEPGTKTTAPAETPVATHRWEDLKRARLSPEEINEVEMAAHADAAAMDAGEEPCEYTPSAPEWDEIREAFEAYHALYRPTRTDEMRAGARKQALRDLGDLILRMVGRAEQACEARAAVDIAERDKTIAALRAELTKRPLRTFDQTAADAMADEVAVLVRSKVIDSRSPAADALLDYRDPPNTPRSDRLADYDKRLAELQRDHDGYKEAIHDAVSNFGPVSADDVVDVAWAKEQLQALVAQYDEAEEGRAAAIHKLDKLEAGIDSLLSIELRHHNGTDTDLGVVRSKLEALKGRDVLTNLGSDGGDRNVQVAIDGLRATFLGPRPEPK